MERRAAAAAPSQIAPLWFQMTSTFLLVIDWVLFFSILLLFLPTCIPLRSVDTTCIIYNTEVAEKVPKTSLQIKHSLYFCQNLYRIYENSSFSSVNKETPFRPTFKVISLFRNTIDYNRNIIDKKGHMFCNNVIYLQKVVYIRKWHL